MSSFSPAAVNKTLANGDRSGLLTGFAFAVVTQNPPPDKRIGSRKYERLSVVFACTLVILSYAWSIRTTGETWTSREPAGFYGLLTDALLAGHLHLNVLPDPRLAALANPYAGAQGIPRIHDATYFNGRYYFYFGITPVLVLFAPWRLLTGTFLTQPGADAIFATIGFLFLTRLWLRLRAGLLPQLSSRWTGIAILVLGWGTYAFVLLQTSDVYNVPILAAFACLMIAFNAVERAFTTSQIGRTAVYLGLASLAWGLAVGARPNYVLSVPLLSLCATILWWRAGGEHGFKSWSAWRILFWAVVPVATVGAGLAWYNYMRFGDIREFGIKYQFAAVDQRFIKFANPENIKSTLQRYLTAGSYYSPYFPFVRPRSDVLGVLVWAPFALIGALFPLTFACRAARANLVWPIISMACAFSILLLLGSLCLLPFANDRYLIDFLPAATLLAVVTAGMAISESRRWPTAIRYGVVFCIVSFAMITVAQSLLLGLQRQSNKSAQHLLALITDYPARWWESWFGLRHGAVELKVVFSRLVPGRFEPLVVTGSGRDIVYLKSEDSTHVRFGFFHQGNGGPLSDMVEIEPTREYNVLVDMGGLYPPPEHPVFWGWNEILVDALRRRVDVRLDQQTVLHWTSSFYPSHPFEISIGKNPGRDITVPSLGGAILKVNRVGIPSQEGVPGVPGDGPLHLTVKFPPFISFTSQPLISTGRPGAGDLIYVSYLRRGRLRFGHDSWQSGNIETVEIDYDPEGEHNIDVDMGSLHQSAPGLMEARNRFQLRFDDKLIISTFRPFHPSSAVDLSIGFNTTGSTAAADIFTGPLLRADRLKDFPQTSIVNHGWGGFRIRAKLPLFSAGRQEPVVVTGRRGAGDFVYLKYEDDHHVRVAEDHWGTSSTTSDPIEVNYGEPVTFVVRMGSLFPEENSIEWGTTTLSERKRLRSRISVEVNGATVLDLPITAYDAQPDEIYAGQNPLGGSSCGTAFTGDLISVQREGLPH